MSQFSRLKLTRKTKMKSQGGFTLIELITSMAIMTIMAASATTKLGGITADARLAKMQGLVGALKVSSVMTYGSAQAELLAPNAPLTMADGSIVAMANYYPEASASGIGNALYLWGYASSVNNGVSVAFYPDDEHALQATCGVVYVQTNRAPIIDTSSISSVTNCV